jgi:ubiquinone/menaquinone biosynthesis C-methylase UbiE
LHGSDLHIRETGIHCRDRWASLHEGDVTQGLPNIDSDCFDIVVCEQVLEHVHDVEGGLATLYRMIKPGGTLVVGVPIFPPGISLIRKHLVPLFDRLNPWAKQRGHVQAFSLTSFSKEVAATGFEIIERRGYRVISGGILKPLENQAWWYRWNRWLGKQVPKLCIETQIVARKPEVGARAA